MDEAAKTPENTAFSLLQKAAESGIKRSEGTPAPNLPKVIRQRQNEVLPTTVEVDLPMVSGVVPSGAEIENVTIIGGAGTSMPIRDIARLVAIYTAIGNPSGWQKKAGIVKGAKYNYELHWYENSSIMPEAEIKLKGVKANEWT